MNPDDQNYLPIGGTTLINEVKKGLISNQNWNESGNKFPNKKLNISSSSAPNDTAIMSIENDENRKSIKECIRDCNKALANLGDRASEIFDISQYLWSIKAESNDEFVVISASEIAQFLGLSKKSGGGIRLRDKKNIAELMNLLQLIKLEADMTIYWYNKNKNNQIEKKRWDIKSPALLISALVKETNTMGKTVTSLEYKWKYRPGDVLIPLLDAPNKSFAYLDRKLIEMCPNNEKFEKRIGKAAVWSIKLNGPDQTLKIQVKTLLKDALVELNKNCPGKTAESFERARRTLLNKGILACFQYSEAGQINSLLTQRQKGWVDNWLKAWLLIESPKGLKDMYIPEKVHLFPENPAGIRYKQHNKMTPLDYEPSPIEKLTKLKQDKTLQELAEFLSCSVSNLSMILNGKRKISKKMKEKIDRHKA